jgi:LmbE family N-acetylglucosaminyl deacetylase
MGDRRTVFQAPKRILAISPHPDDAEFGAGGLLHRWRGESEVHLAVLSDRGPTRGEQHNDRDQLRAAACLGIPERQVAFVDQLGLDLRRLPIRFMGTEENRDRIRRLVEHLTREIAPEVILVPSPAETMQDHQALAEETVRVLRGDVSILGYETPKHNRGFVARAWLQVSEADVEAKIAAVNCYSEFTTRYYFEPEAIRALARVRGLDQGAGHTYAEAFEVLRLVG